MLLAGAKDFPEKGSKRESQTVSPSVPAARAAVEEAKPTLENGKVAPPRRLANRERRAREHLTLQEVDKLIKAASRVGRYGHRDATVILIAYRHGLRVSELVALRWDQADLEQGLLHVSRLKNGVPSTHALRGPEIRALRRLRREYGTSPVVGLERATTQTSPRNCSAVGLAPGRDAAGYSITWSAGPSTDRGDRQVGMVPPVQGHMRPVSKTHVTADTPPATSSHRLLQDLRDGRPGRA